MLLDLVFGDAHCQQVVEDVLHGRIVQVDGRSGFRATRRWCVDGDITGRDD